MIETSNILPHNRPIDLNAQIGTNNGTNTSFREIMYQEQKHQKFGKEHDFDTIESKIDESALSRIERGNFESQAIYMGTKGDAPSVALKDQVKKYKEDQLLSKPGGDHFHLDEKADVINYHTDYSGFSERVGKDLKDAMENFLNIFKDLGPGAGIKYVDKDGHIQEDKKVGLIGTLVNFFQDIASGVTLGKYAKNGEDTPDTTLEAAKYFLKKIFVDAIFKDVIVGVPRSAIHVGEDAAFACINFAETIPDATVGNFKAGQVATTEVFDDFQVFVDFVTDVIPMGEANSRTRAFTLRKGFKGLPVIHNITEPEQGGEDENWKYVRNTPFRKAIESFATLIPIRT